ncbi:MAG: addiction module protein [Gemmataceae bacterium]
MSEATKELLSAVRALPEVELREFAEALLEGLPTKDADDEWAAELERRWQGYLSGERPGIPAEEVYRQLRAEFRKPA